MRFHEYHTEWVPEILLVLVLQWGSLQLFERHLTWPHNQQYQQIFNKPNFNLPHDSQPITVWNHPGHFHDSQPSTGGSHTDHFHDSWTPQKWLQKIDGLVCNNSACSHHFLFSQVNLPKVAAIRNGCGRCAKLDSNNNNRTKGSFVLICYCAKPELTQVSCNSTCCFHYETKIKFRITSSLVYFFPPPPPSSSMASCRRKILN